MIGYITLGTNSLERAGKFYDALLAELGAKRTMTDKRMLGWGSSMGFYGGYFRDLDGNKLVVYCLGWKPID